MLGLDPDLGVAANPPFEMDNRSKRSMVLDLGTVEGGRPRANYLPPQTFS